MMPRVSFVTIVTRSHVCDARLAMAGIHSDAFTLDRWVLVIDADSGTNESTPDIRFLCPAEVVDAPTLQAMRKRYTAGEVCFALKPHVLSYLLGKGASQVHYVDADLGFYSPVDLLIEALVGHDMLLTPHFLDMPPDDGRHPTALTLLTSGVFNGGYFGVSATSGALGFLSWWRERVRRHGRDDRATGQFGDQRWLDLVPVLFPGGRIYRNPGANVAYWNLHERELKRTDGRYYANGEPLIFFHFSGFDPYHPERLSRYQTRFLVTPNTPLADLLDAYAQQLLSAGYAESRKRAYAYHRWWHSNRLLIRTARNWYFRFADWVS